MSKVVAVALSALVLAQVEGFRRLSKQAGAVEEADGKAQQLEEVSNTWRQVRVNGGFGGSHGLVPLSGDAVLVSDTYQNSRAVYQINASTGVLSLYMQFQQLSQPSGLAFSSDMGFIYVCDVGTSAINMHRASDNSLFRQIRANGAPWNIRYTSDNEMYYVTFQGSVRRLNSQLVDVQVGSRVPNAYDLVLLSNQIYVTSMEGSLYQIDIPTGRTTIIATFGAGSVAEGIDSFVDSDGREKLVVADTQLGKIYKVDPRSGTTTVLLDGNNNPRFRIPINVRTRGRQVFVNALDPSGNMVLLVGNLR